jgi:hypothetical protein
MRRQCGALCGALLGLALNSSAFDTLPPTSQSVTLAWNASPDPTVVGYNISYGGASGVYTNTVNVGTNMQFTLSGLTPGSTYYFVTTSYNASGIQSIPTPEVAYVVPGLLSVTGPSVTNLAVNLQFAVASSTSYQLQASSDLRSWSNIWTFSSGSTNGVIQFSEPFLSAVSARFYRLLTQ